eukprot:1181180-Prorocentrum_minimum.AAC.3
MLPWRVSPAAAAAASAPATVGWGLGSARTPFARCSPSFSPPLPGREAPPPRPPPPAALAGRAPSGAAPPAASGEGASEEEFRLPRTLLNSGPPRPWNGLGLTCRRSSGGVGRRSTFGGIATDREGASTPTFGRRWNSSPPGPLNGDTDRHWAAAAATLALAPSAPPPGRPPAFTFTVILPPPEGSSSASAAAAAAAARALPRSVPPSASPSAPRLPLPPRSSGGPPLSPPSFGPPLVCSSTSLSRLRRLRWRPQKARTATSVLLPTCSLMRTKSRPCSRTASRYSSFSLGVHGPSLITADPPSSSSSSAFSSSSFLSLRVEGVAAPKEEPRPVEPRISSPSEASPAG